MCDALLEKDIRLFESMTSSAADSAACPGICLNRGYCS